MNKDEKMWYSLKEAAEYLHMEQSVLQRKINGLNFETRMLPGERDEFLAKKDMLDIEQMVRGRRSTC